MSEIPPEVLAVPQGTRERVRAELLRRAKTGEPNTNRAIREAVAPAQSSHVALLLRLVAAGELSVGAPWVVHAAKRKPGRPPKAKRPGKPAPSSATDEEDEAEDPEALAAAILAARSHDDLQALAQRIAAAVASATMEPRAANALSTLLKEARSNQMQVVKAQPDVVDPDRTLLAGPEAYELVEAFEGIVSDERREAVLRYVRSQAEVDRAEQPNKTGATDAP